MTTFGEILGWTGIVVILTVLVARVLVRPLVWTVEVVDARHRRRHDERRRARAKGYVPIHDEGFVGKRPPLQ